MGTTMLPGVPKRTDVASDEEEDDAAAAADPEADPATDTTAQLPGTPPFSPPAARTDDRDGGGNAAAGPGSPVAATPRRESALRRWSWMDGGDAGQPPDTGNSIDPPAQEDQVSGLGRLCGLSSLVLNRDQVHEAAQHIAHLSL